MRSWALAGLPAATSVRGSSVTYLSARYWLDTETGEVKRGRVAPADRAGVRRFLERFRGQELEVALEATTGWRFVAEELRRVGAVVHLAEPAETAGSEEAREGRPGGRQASA